MLPEKFNGICSYEGNTLEVYYEVHQVGALHRTEDIRIQNDDIHCWLCVYLFVTNYRCVLN